ncbi:MAG: hypothetical protein ACI8TP_003633 [Acidimicrobiales bacterium]|jgi:hypothetical protein
MGVSGWAIADQASANTGAQVQIWVLDNDTSPAALGYASLRIVTAPADGTVSVHTPPGNPSNVRIRYQSDQGFAGDDALVYEICDVNGDCAHGTVTVTVE